MENDIPALVASQRKFFLTGCTLDVKWRIRQLKALRDALIRNEKVLEDALARDLGKSRVEAYLCDIGPSIMEINEAIRGLRRWARPELHFSGLHCFPSIITRVYKLPYGVTLIISPFNFPILLTLGVLAASIAGGNTAVIKASSKSPACTAALKHLLSEVFPPEYVSLVDGGHDVADICLEQAFDKVFYTGSPAVGRHVLAMAAPNLTPVALELGGETGNWCVVRKDAELRDAARKIAFAKCCNSGQICINVNQVAVAEEVAERFTGELCAAFEHLLGREAESNGDYPHLISQAAYDRCASLADSCRSRIICGGRGDRASLRYAPTVIYPVRADEPLVQQELFNPLLPVVPFPDCEADAMLELIEKREHPLAMYLFTSDRKWARKVMSTLRFGGGCINETIVHLMVKGAPFNGVGHSGMGAYHGEWGFREFTHPQTVLEGCTKLNLPLREHPYSGRSGELKMKLLRFVFKHS